MKNSRRILSHHSSRVVFWFDLGGDFDGCEIIDKNEIKSEFEWATNNICKSHEKASGPPVYAHSRFRSQCLVQMR